MRDSRVISYYYSPVGNSSFLRGLISVAVALLFCVSAAPALAQGQIKPYLVLRDVMQYDQQIAEKVDWKKMRFPEGIGWKIGSVSRGDGTVMKGGFTVVHPTKGNPFALKHWYTIACFDLLPRGYLMVTVRDPELYWDGYNFDDGVVDPLELVWLDDNWLPIDRKQLEFGELDYPDKFNLSPDRRWLLCVLHPVDGQGKLRPEGQELYLINLKTLAISKMYLPETDGMGQLPSAWYPLKMDWKDRNRLLVQTGQELRMYEVRWQ